MGLPPVMSAVFLIMWVPRSNVCDVYATHPLGMNSEWFVCMYVLLILTFTPHNKVGTCRSLAQYDILQLGFDICGLSHVLLCTLHDFFTTLQINNFVNYIMTKYFFINT
jgi:hypothetical protein